MITDIHAQLVLVMNELAGDGQPFSEIFPYPVAMPKVFPFAMIDIDGGIAQTDEASNAKILRTNFIVRCLFRQENSEAATAQRMEVLDQVLEKFTEQGIADYLNNTVLGMDIKSIETFAIDEEQPVFGFDVIIECRTLMEVE